MGFQVKPGMTQVLLIASIIYGGIGLLTNKEIALNAAKTINEKKGIDVVIIDVSELSSYADYLVVASGSNDRHIDSLVGDVDDNLSKEGIKPRHIEGRAASGWVLMDYGDIIVNVFSRDQRSYYNIEQIWSDGQVITEEGV
jgi:ribosome-associated protein